MQHISNGTVSIYIRIVCQDEQLYLGSADWHPEMRLESLYHWVPTEHYDLIVLSLQVFPFLR